MRYNVFKEKTLLAITCLITLLSQHLVNLISQVQSVFNTKQTQCELIFNDQLIDSKRSTVVDYEIKFFHNGNLWRL